MKELDVLLERFLVASASELDSGEWPDLEQFLQFEDDTLWDSLREPGCSPDPAFDALISAIRDVRK